MPTLYPTRTRLRLLQSVRDEKVIATRESGQHPWVFLDLSVPTKSGGQLVISAINEMLSLTEPWVSFDEPPADDRTPRAVQLTRLGELLVTAQNPAQVVGL